jgi:hypothetical protein
VNEEEVKKIVNDVAGVVSNKAGAAMQTALDLMKLEITRIIPEIVALIIKNQSKVTNE